MVIIVSGIILLCYMRWEATRNVVCEHSLSVETNTLHHPLTIFFISDVHNRRISNRLLRQLNNRPIDLIIIGGDLAERGVSPTRIRDNLQALAQYGPLYYVFGNNDREIGEAVLLQLLEECNVTIIQNETIPIPDKENWGLSGTDDPSSQKVDFNATFRYIKTYEHIVFVAHSPQHFHRVDDYVMPVLKMAGHTHGGQIRLGPFGLHERGSFTIGESGATLVSNGYGTTCVPLRLGAPAETHLITIRAKKNEEE